jgi:hypothetical protein
MELTVWRIVSALTGIFIYVFKDWSAPVAWELISLEIVAGSLMWAAILPPSWRFQSWAKFLSLLVAIMLGAATAYLTYKDLAGPYVVDYVGAVFKCAFLALFVVTMTRNTTHKN